MLLNLETFDHILEM